MSNPDGLAAPKPIKSTVQTRQGKLKSVIQAINQPTRHVRPEPPRLVFIPRLRRTSSWRAYGQALIVVALCTLLAWLMFPYFAQSSLIMVYLVGIVIVAARCGRGPSIMASILSVAVFDFFFVPPFLTFVVSDSQAIVTFAVMLLVAITISSLTTRIKQQGEAAKEREQRIASLYALSRELANTPGTDNLVSIARQHIGDLLQSRVIIFLPGRDGQLQTDPDNTADLSDLEKSAARWVYAHGQVAGVGTETFSDTHGLYLPLIGSQSTVGVLGIFFERSSQGLSPDQVDLLDTFANQTALAIERAHLAEEAEHARVQIETERMRNSLLSSVSHDLRTPLASITGAVSSLLENEKTQSLEVRHELAQVAYEEAERLNRLVGNLLAMTRLESGGVHVTKEWQPLEEVVGATLNRLSARLNDRPVTVNLPASLPLVPLDSVLLEQVTVNLLENAVKYTPPGSPIELSATADDAKVTVEIADHGPGLTPGDEQRIFDKFYRAQPTTTTGVGLGLTISRGIIEAHGGLIWAENRPGGGAVFRFTLPLDGSPPEVNEANAENG